MKTRTSHDVKPAQTAIDREKRRELPRMARDHLRRVREEVQWRFDVVTFYYETPGTAHIELFKNAYPVS